MMIKKISLQAMIDNWPSPFVAREEVGRFSGGILTPKTLANLDCKGIGPKGRIRCGRKIAYPTASLVELMESRCSLVNEK